MKEGAVGMHILLLVAGLLSPAALVYATGMTTN